MYCDAAVVVWAHIARNRLLHRALGAGLLELLHRLLAVGLAGALLDRLGRGLDRRLGLLEAEPRDLAHDLQHGDLLVGGELVEDEVEFALLSVSATRIARRGGARRRRGHHD